MRRADISMNRITRFAPSPTGLLHLGHMYSALMCQKIAGSGQMLLRYEDIDYTRVRPEYYEMIAQDLAWIGVTYQPNPIRQTDRFTLYRDALQDLQEKELVYPCFCTRKELQQQVQIDAPQQGVPHSRYNGKCRNLSPERRQDLIQRGVNYCWRLDSAKVARYVRGKHFSDAKYGVQEVNAEIMGDVVVARKDIGTSYHIAVVIDDAAQGVTDIVRGEDLLYSTHIHRALQEVWALPEPAYHHHRLIEDEQGQRLAKRCDSRSLRFLRDSGASLESLMQRVSPLIL